MRGFVLYARKMRELHELAPTYDTAYDSIKEQVNSLRRELSAMLMAEYPDKDFLVQQAELLQGATQADAVQVNVILHDKQLTIVSQPNSETVTVTIDARNSLCVFTVSGDEPMTISDIRHDPFLEEHPGKDLWGAWASVPVIIAGQSAGTVCTFDNDSRVWTPEDEAMLQRVADSISKAVNEWAGNTSF